MTRVIRGRYELGPVVGQGGMATVYRAHDRVLDAVRAVKILRGPARSKPEIRARFAREARAMAALEHPHVARVYDHGDDEDDTFLVMTWAEGGTLDDQLGDGRSFPIDRAVDLMSKVLDGLQAAHDAGIIHRDVKPANVLLDGDGEPLVSDFGIARVSREALRHTRDGAMLGSMAYMAPEQRLDAHEVDVTADVYAAAATFYELVTGASPMDLFVYPEEDPRWARVPAAFRPVLLRALSHAPRRRHPSARALKDDLQAALARHHAAPEDAPVRPPPASLADTRSWYRESLRERAVQVRDLLQALTGGDLAAGTALRRVAHALRGSGATFGFPRVTEVAATVEDAPEPALAGRATELLYVLRHVAEAETAHDVVVATSDAALRDRVRATLARPGRAVIAIEHRDDVERLLGEGGVGAAVLDLREPDFAPLRGRPLVGTTTLPRAVVAVGPPDAELRARALADGACAFLPLPLEPVALASTVESALHRDADAATFDPVTRLPDRATFRLAAVRAQQRTRTSEAWVVGAVRWPSLERLAAGEPRQAVVQRIATALEAALPTSVLLARWDVGTFTLLATGSGVDGLEDAVRAALRAAAEAAGAEHARHGAALVTGAARQLGAVLLDALEAAAAQAEGRGDGLVLQARPAEASARVLVADDDLAVVEMVTRVASSAGWVCRAVLRGDEVLPAVRDFRPDLVVLDVQLPEIDGFEVLRTLRADPDADGVRVLMLTALDREAHVVLGLELGADDYVVKPFDPAVLRARLRTLLRRTPR
ncbi:MAG: protein kinase [Alphaproteobacteria bacterium]|nr:protein kinase [Alphaproteobacteria bacterium]